MTSRPATRNIRRVPNIAFAIVVFTLAAIATSAACSTAEQPKPAASASVAPPSDAAADAGSLLYASSCAVCHGPNGEGQPDWRVRRPDGSFLPPPHDSSGHTWHHPDGVLYEIVRDGGLTAAGFVSGMPAFGALLTPEEIRAVLEYIKTLWGPDERAAQARLSEADPYP
ncbi:MAG TPA: cytochrome c [Dehalococcoidia bacterium]|nr:cytochrome c [Dehalococcoidia bacterium]